MIMLVDNTIYTEMPVELDMALRLEKLGFTEACYYARSIEDGSLDVGQEYTGQLHITIDDIEHSRENEYPAVLAPTRSHIQSWLRRKHWIHINVTSSSLESYTLSLTSHADTKWNLGYEDMQEVDFESYEDAVDRGIELAVKILEDERSTSQES
jgi:hypothetical protein